MDETIKVAELFAGVGGFRLGLDGYHSEEHPEFEMPSAGPYVTVWANQWEPPGSEGKQFAWRCYESRFGKGSCVNEDIHEVMDRAEAGDYDIPDVDMVVGGFPCQDYSVAHTLKSAAGIEGKKGVLWWEIYRFLKLKQPRYCLFENVDRLLKSPASQRGRDFAIMLSCLMSLGYAVEWRVVNSAEYGFPQRRKRVFIFAERSVHWNLEARLTDGVMATAFPYLVRGEVEDVLIPDDPYTITKKWGGFKVSPFREAGVACDGIANTAHVSEVYDGERRVLGDVIVDADEVPDEYWVPDSQLEKWEYLKGYKREKRTASNGHEYWYSEGQMAYPDLLTNPSRTILTGEGGSGASRFKHIIDQDGRMRRLVPDELDTLQGYPRGWTDTGMSDTRRAFCMGNALVVGVVHRVGEAIACIHAVC
ncbi:MAG: DNA (cytosine-5-)-methyltransferase [Coriobacteriales bacterium]|nr:DNA (cytosine-5-)-methyltransferase [Coriobacteriales bacterium]